MRLRGILLSFCLVFVASLSGCELTAANPLACMLKDPMFCGAGMYCDHTLNACQPETVDPDKEPFPAHVFTASCNAEQFCTFVSPTFQYNLNAIYGTGPSDIWAVGDEGVTLHWNGATWTGVPSSIFNNLRGVWGTAPNNYYAVGDGGIILHFDGSIWSGQVVSGQTSLKAVSGLDASHIWAVGAGGAMLYSSDGLQFNPASNPSESTLYGAWVDSNPGNKSIFAVGAASAIIANSADNMQTTTPQSNPGNPNFSYYAISGSASQNYFWAVGQQGQITQWLNGECMPVTTVTSSDLRGVWTASSTVGWAVGDNGTILSIDPGGSLQWSKQTSGTNTPLRAVWGSSSTDVWSVGASGNLIHWPGMPQ